QAVKRLKQEPGGYLGLGGVTLPLALAELGLIDEYDFVVHPQIAGHGPTLFEGLSKYVDLELVGRREFGSGAVALRYEPRGGMPYLRSSVTRLTALLALPLAPWRTPPPSRRVEMRCGCWYGRGTRHRRPPRGR